MLRTILLNTLGYLLLGATSSLYAQDFSLRGNDQSNLTPGMEWSLPTKGVSIAARPSTFTTGSSERTVYIDVFVRNKGVNPVLVGQSGAEFSGFKVFSLEPDGQTRLLNPRQTEDRHAVRQTEIAAGKTGVLLLCFSSEEVSSLSGPVVLGVDLIWVKEGQYVEEILMSAPLNVIDLRKAIPEPPPFPPEWK